MRRSQVLSLPLTNVGICMTSEDFHSMPPKNRLMKSFSQSASAYIVHVQLDSHETLLRNLSAKSATAWPPDQPNGKRCQSTFNFFLVWLHYLLIGCFVLSGFR